MKKELSPGLAILPIIAIIITASLSVFVWDAGMIFPLIFGIIVASIIVFISGWKWDEIQTMMVEGVSKALPAVFILLIIGTIVGSWIASGIIPTIIYYGLIIIQPDVFVPIVALVTGLVSLSLGSSFTSIATVGLAFMMIGEGFGFPAGITAGAIISGAFFGDKLSPLSDTTNIAPVLADTDLFSHVKHMLWDTIPAFIISIILFWIVGNSNAVSGMADVETMDRMKEGLDKLFLIHPLLLLMPIVTIIIILKKVPAIPALMVVSFLGAVIAVLVQGESITSVIQTMTNGFTGESEVTAINSLLNNGGLTSMLATVCILILATALGGVLDGSGAFYVLTRKIMSLVRTTGSLISSTIFSTFLIAFTTGEQFISIILPTRTFAYKYKEMGIDTKNLSRAVESAGTVGINLVPWGIPAVFAADMLGVSPIEFIPFAFFVFLVPLINIILGYTGWTITRKEYANNLK